MVPVATVPEADVNASDANAEIVGNNRTGGDHKSRRFSVSNYRYVYHLANNGEYGNAASLSL